MIVLNVLYRLRPGTRAAFEEGARAIEVVKRSRADDGNLSYGYFRPVEEEDALLCVEGWRDKESFLAHLKTDHVAQLQDLKKQYVLETVLHEYQVEE